MVEYRKHEEGGWYTTLVGYDALRPVYYRMARALRIGPDVWELPNRDSLRQG